MQQRRSNCTDYRYETGPHYTCEVNLASAGEEAIFVWLTHIEGTFTSQQFMANLSRKEVLAVALAAITSSKQVWAHLDSTEMNSNIRALGLMP